MKTSIYIANPGIRMAVEDSVLSCFSDEMQVFMDFKEISIKLVKYFYEITLETLTYTAAVAEECPYLGALLALREKVNNFDFSFIEL